MHKMKQMSYVVMFTKLEIFTSIKQDIAIKMSYWVEPAQPGITRKSECIVHVCQLYAKDNLFIRGNNIFKPCSYADAKFMHN